MIFLRRNSEFISGVFTGFFALMAIADIAYSIGLGFLPHGSEWARSLREVFHVFTPIGAAGLWFVPGVCTALGLWAASNIAKGLGTFGSYAVWSYEALSLHEISHNQAPGVTLFGAFGLVNFLLLGALILGAAKNVPIRPGSLGFITKILDGFYERGRRHRRTGNVQIVARPETRLR